MAATAPVAAMRRRGPTAGAASGSVLIIVIVLLLLASSFVVFGLNVGRFEQRTSGNDLRARIAHEVAEAGIASGFEFFNANRDLVRDPNRWRLCGAGETNFPCGAVPQFDEDGLARRGTMYAYYASGDGTSFVQRLLPLPPSLAIASVGAFEAQQQVGAVLCRVARPAGPGAPTACATNDADASSTWVITVVSKGLLPTEGTNATVTQTFAAYRILDLGPGAPPLVASGSVSVGGGLQIVAAANAAGSGVPVSVWTRLEVLKSGTPNTCYHEEFLRQGGSSDAPAYYDGLIICHTCKCPGSGSLSYPLSGGNACHGVDLVAIDRSLAVGQPGSNPPACPMEPNLNIRREEFPKDLFAFLFGTKAWDDVNRDGIAPEAPCTSAALDCNFAEQRRVSSCTYLHPVTGAPTTATLPDDTCFLLGIEDKIHIGDGVDDAAECAALGPSTSGFVWVHSQRINDDLPGYTCDRLGGPIELGMPSQPIALIHDGPLHVNTLTLYGLMFLREQNGSLTLDKETGGSAEFRINGNANIYGIVVIQGEVTGNGSGAIVHNSDLLLGLADMPANVNPNSMPGSWTDRVRY